MTCVCGCCSREFGDLVDGEEFGDLVARKWKVLDDTINEQLLLFNWEELGGGNLCCSIGRNFCCPPLLQGVWQIIVGSATVVQILLLRWLLVKKLVKNLDIRPRLLHKPKVEKRPYGFGYQKNRGRTWDFYFSPHPRPKVDPFLPRFNMLRF